jgi:hypothetical protein
VRDQSWTRVTHTTRGLTLRRTQTPARLNMGLNWTARMDRCKAHTLSVLNQLSTRPRAVDHRRDAPCGLENISATLPASSVALDDYLHNVYGPPRDDAARRARSAAWRWDDVDVVWLRHLPRSLSGRCTWVRAPRFSGDVFLPSGHPNCGLRPAGLLWIYRFESVCNDERLQSKPERGGARVPVHVEERQWVEVTHAFPSYQHLWNSERSGLWMYEARGSGLWHHAGRTLVASDVIDLARFLNVSFVDYGPYFRMNVSTAALMPRSPPGFPQVPKSVLFARTQKVVQRASLGVASVLMTHHLDLHRAEGSLVGVLPCCPMQGYFKRELMSLRTQGYVRLQCPPTPTSQPQTLPPQTLPPASTSSPPPLAVVPMPRQGPIASKGALSHAAEAADPATDTFAWGDRFSGLRPCRSCVPNAHGGDAVVLSAGRVQRPLFFPYKYVQCAFVTSASQLPLGSDPRAPVVPTPLSASSEREYTAGLAAGAAPSYDDVARASAHIAGFEALRNDSKMAVQQRKEDEEALCMGARTYKPPARRRRSRTRRARQ